MEQRNREKASILYDFIDRSGLFRGRAHPDARSVMNATFTTGSPELDKEFVAASERAGFVGLKGHRSVGGMRASLYNAVPVEAVRELVSFMAAFEREHAPRASA